MKKRKAHKKSKKFLGLQLHSNPKKGMVGWLLKHKIVHSQIKAEIFLLSFSAFCLTLSAVMLHENFDQKQKYRHYRYEFNSASTNEFSDYKHR